MVNFIDFGEEKGMTAECRIPLGDWHYCAFSHFILLRVLISSSILASQAASLGIW